MHLHVLGPVEARSDQHALPVGGPKARAVLAMLGLEANRTVSADRLIDGLWGEHPPVSAAKMLQNYVWRLRTALGEDADAQIVTRGRGYELRIDPEAVDVRRFERLLAAANRADAAGQPADAARQALALWRGPALSDVADEPFAAAEIRRLEELRVEAAELAVAADLAAGRHREVAAEIDTLVAAHPLRERLHAQRMLAFYRCGRQADALEAYRLARRTLVEEIGVEPGPELQRLHEAILNQDPELELTVTPRELPPALDTAGAPPLAGRTAELEWLHEGWRAARAGEGALVTLAGEPRLGKTRLAAEIAGQAHRDGAIVLYAPGTAPAGTVLAALTSARHPARETLLVLDDVDRAGAEVRDALSRLAPELRSVPLLVVATGEDADALAGLRPRAARALEPLDAAAVQQIAALYAPPGLTVEVPVAALLEVSRGIPGAAHEAAGEWARDEAARRVDAVAGQAATGRPRARAIEAELAGSVEELQQTRERVTRLAAGGDDRPGAVVCPYKGLAPFDGDDAEYFFGRERLVAELVARIVGAPLLGVVGPSGSGKSSVVRAGLLPALGAGLLPGSETWTRAVIRPGAHPLGELERVAQRRAPRRMVLAVDQFEEVFTACADEQERSAFVDALVDAARDPDGRTVVVLALRADFYGRCAAYPGLSALLGANHVLVGAMSEDDLRRAIELPAKRAGLGLEAGLVERLLADCADEPGALPLLSTALLELWQRRDGDQLRLAAYERTGGVRGAVARLAETAYDRLDPEGQVVARRILLRLAGDDVDGTPVRRRVTLTELDGDRGHDVRRVLAVLADSRMVTISEGSVEVAHEALLREWPRLCAWLDEDQEGRRLHRRLGEAAREWSDGGRDRSELYRAGRLASALEWRTVHEPDLNLVEHEFLEASLAAAERARRRVRLGFAGILALLALVTGAGVVALDQRAKAHADARAADAQRLGAQALAVDRLDVALLLARQAVALDDTPVTRESLLAVLRRSPAAIGLLRADGDALTAIALHPDGRTLAVGDDDGTVTFLDTVTRRRLGAPHQIAGAIRTTAVAFSPDGSRFAATGVQGPVSGPRVDLFDGRTRRHLGQIGDFPNFSGSASLHFTPDSRRLAAKADRLDETTSTYWEAWDARTGRGLGRTVRSLPRSSTVLGFMDSGRRVVTTREGSGETVIRDGVTLRALRRFPVVGSAAALSPAAGLVAFGGRDGSVRLLDLRTGRLRLARGRHDAPVVALRFDPGGGRLITTSRDERLIVWDARRAAALETLPARGMAIVNDLVIASDRRSAFSAGGDGTVIAWDLTGKRGWERPFGADGTQRRSQALVVEPRAATFAVIDGRGFVDLFDARTRHRTGRVRPVRGRAANAAVAPDGRTVAIAAYDGVDGTLEWWDARTRRRLGAPQAGHPHTTKAATFSADGRWLATGDGIVRLALWDARRRTLVRDGHGGVADLSFSPDGATLAVTLDFPSFSGGLRILSVPDLRLLRTVRVPEGTVGRYSPDGRSLVYGDRDGRVWILDSTTWKPRGRPLQAGGALLTADLSADGRLLATTSSDGSGRLWDVASAQPTGARSSGASGAAVGAGFAEDGRLLVLHERVGVTWDVRPAAATRHACAVAGRPLTRAEWERALPQHDYAPACGQG